MRNKEFIKKVQRLRFRTNIKLDNKGKIFCITIGDGKENFVRIWSYPYAISTFDNQFTFCKGDLPLMELYKLCFEYASTPVEDREEEKKFYLRHKYLQSSLTNPNNILCYAVSDDKLALCNGVNFPKYKSYLTLKEIEEIKEKFDTDLSDFELVEVVDE